MPAPLERRAHRGEHGRWVDFAGERACRRDLHYLSLDEVARRLKARKLSSVEATRAILDRIDKLDPKLKSYATADARARARRRRARATPRRRPARSRGPLHGVPIAVKDLCNTAGVPTAAGMAIHRDTRAGRGRHRRGAAQGQAGAVILGKLQMTEGAYGAAPSDASTPPVNPWNAAYWTGVVLVGLGRGDGGRPVLRLARLRHRRLDPLSHRP